MYKIYLLPLFFILFVMFLTSCAEEATREDSPVPVRVVQPEAHEPYLTKSYPSLIRASSEVNISFRVPGPVMEIFVEEGEEVAEGQLLARIDPRDYETQLEATKAEYEGIKAEAERIISLYERGRVSTSDYDKAISGLQQITAKYQAHQDALEDTRLKAPFDGQVGQLHFRPPELIDAGMPVMSLSSHKDLEVKAHLPDRDLMRQQDFVSFSMSTSLHPEKLRPLKLRNISHTPGLNGMYPAYFHLADTPDQKILPGMRVEVSITYRGDFNTLLTIPSAAVFHDNEQAAVWRIDPDDHTVSKVPVEIVSIGNDGTARIAADLTADDRLVAAGVNSLSEGQTVKPLEAPADSNVGDIL